MSPDIIGVTPLYQEKYKVRRYNNAVHPEYNGLNPFEVRLADALEALGKPWARNSSKTGYSIPIPVLGADTANFYPDFLLWTDEGIWAIDPKGNHLKEGAVLNKLLNLSAVRNNKIPVRIALVLQGSHDLGQTGHFQKTGNRDGFTLIRKTSSGDKAREFDDIYKLITTLVDE